MTDVNVQLDSLRLERDASCLHCGYNLRSIAVAHACPECGNPASDSLVTELLDDSTERGASFVQIESLQIRIASEIARCPAEAVAFVWDAVHQYFAREWTARSDLFVATRGTLTARQICAAVRDEAVRAAGSYETAQKLLLDAGIANSADIGRVIDALARARLFRYRLSPDACDFAGLMLFDGLVHPVC